MPSSSTKSRIQEPEPQSSSFEGVKKVLRGEVGKVGEPSLVLTAILYTAAWTGAVASLWISLYLPVNKEHM